MKPAARRKAFVYKTISDPDFNLTLKEAALHLYYWYNFEKALRMKKKAIKKQNKYGKKLYTDVQAFKLRKSMNDL